MIPRQIAALKPAERLKLVMEIWDSLTDIPDSVPVTPAQKNELSRRAEKYRKNPHGGIPWSEVKKRLQ